MNKLRKRLIGEKWKKSILLACIIAMLTGLLFSRAILSCGLIVFLFARIVHRNFLHQVKNYFASPFLWSMSLLFFLPFMSCLWSHDISQGLQISLIKLPLLLLPICFAGDNFLSTGDWKRIAFAFLIITTAGICWSLLQYFPNAVSVHAGYLEAHTIDTPLDNDHVRFSLLVAISGLVAFYLLTLNRSPEKKITPVLLIISIAIIVLYLYVLAVRTGILCLFIALPGCFIWSMRKAKGRAKYIIVLVLMLLLPVISYFVFPTYKNRVKYLRYDWSLIQRDIFMTGSNDGNRFFSIEAGWAVLKKNPFTGVGFGDIRKETGKIYESNYPGADTADKILPSSEWMMYGAGVGWAGFILFSFAMFIPFFIKALRRNIFWILLNCFFVSSYLFDIGLEVQFGVFLHAFVLLWWYKWLLPQE